MLLAAALTAVSAGAAAPSPAPPPTIAPAGGDSVEAHLQRAREHSVAGRHERAIDELRAAYELEPRPELLLGLARSYRQLGRTSDAAYFYERFVSVSPAGPPRDAAADELRAMKQEAQPAVAPTGAEPSTPAVARTAPAPARPLWRRWWVWAGVAVLAGGATAFLLLRDRDPTSVPPTDLGNQRFFP